MFDMKTDIMRPFSRLTLKQLRIFEIAAQHRHFGRAAEALHLTQPAVSIQLKQLEGEIGVPLFEQMGRRMYLTAAGFELLAHTQGIFARLREAQDALRSYRGDNDGGDLHIASTTTAEYFVPRLLAEFRRSRPRLKIRLTVKNRELVVRELAENTIDLALMGRAPENLDTVAVPFAKHPFVIIAPTDHPLVARRKLRLAQLKNQPFLIRERDSGTRHAMERHFAARRFHPIETIEIGSNETIKQAVMAGMGISFLSTHTIALELASGRIGVLDVAGMPVVRNWCVIHRAQKRLSPPAAAFKAYLLADGASSIERALK
jgi:LysR family transcriptional regulator, low CO2-responsive transcriptional regulator